jgi:hypothetical protein
VYLFEYLCCAVASGKPLTADDIEEFLGSYRGSDEEKSDVCEQVRKTRGDVTLLLSTIMGSKDEDVVRLLSVVEELFEEKALPKSMHKVCWVLFCFVLFCVSALIF